ncbi:MAG: hypothetical protein EP330_26240 [Deltaproteobacteria bacterium]|nr:MAG: hypothetical protein EP330_26240 [Deltaproteobacteria bacterium]
MTTTRHALAALALTALAAPGTASATECVAFVHGTGDQSVSAARDDYWTQGALDKFRSGRAHVVVGYQGGEYPAWNEASWGDVAHQIKSFSDSTGCTGITVVTHSNGSNPVRYLLMHPTSYTSSGHGSFQVSALTSKFAQVIWLAGDNNGTPLADKMFQESNSLADSVLQFVGGLAGYRSDAVYQQRTDNMATFNSNGTFNNSASGGVCGPGSSTCNGVDSKYSLGTDVNAKIWDGDAYCGGFLGYGYSVALYAAQAYGWGSNSACTDGFIGCGSQSYNGVKLMEDSDMNHHQSRRDCQGVTGAVAAAVQNAPYVYVPPPEPTIENGVDTACLTSVQGWFGDIYYAGCPDNWIDDGWIDHDCAVTYGADDGAVLPQDYNLTSYADYSCPDSWRGDGWCDACVVAKYGADVLPGDPNGADDCSVQTTNYCSDVAYESGVGWGTVTYTTSH